MDTIFKDIKERFDERFRDILSGETQGYKHHHEGDVYTHTMMVVKEAYNYEHYKDDRERWIFILSAFLHDIGKPLARVQEDGKIIHSGHSGIGVYQSIDFLTELRGVLDLEWDDIMRILYIINYHDAHWHLQGMFESLIRYHEQLYNDLKLFNQFDLKGRIVSDKIMQRYPSVEFVTAEKEFDDSKKIIILIGIPNAGKDTYLRHLKISRDCIVSRDDIMTEYGTKKYGEMPYSEFWKRFSNEDHQNVNNIMWSKYQSLLKDSSVKEIYINLTNGPISSRRKWLRHYFETHYKVFLVDLQTIWERNQKRYEKEGKLVPEDAIINMLKGFHLPLADGEGQNIVDVEYLINTNYYSLKEDQVVKKCRVNSVLTV